MQTLSVFAWTAIQGRLDRQHLDLAPIFSWQRLDYDPHRHYRILQPASLPREPAVKTRAVGNAQSQTETLEKGESVVP